MIGVDGEQNLCVLLLYSRLVVLGKVGCVMVGDTYGSGIGVFIMVGLVVVVVVGGGCGGGVWWRAMLLCGLAWLPWGLVLMGSKIIVRSRYSS